jgi:hypothetical protein
MQYLPLRLLPGQKGFEAISAGGGGKFGEEVGAIRVRRDGIRTRHFDKRVKPGAHCTANGGLAEQANTLARIS